MKRYLFILFFVAMFSLASAQTSVEYFYGIGCPHCENVAKSGVLEKINQTVSVEKFETWYDIQNKQRFGQLILDLKVPDAQRGVPFLLINCSGKVTYLVGDQPIIDNAEKYASTCNFEGKGNITGNAVAGSLSSSGWIAIGVLVAILVAGFLYWKKR